MLTKIEFPKAEQAAYKRGISKGYTDGRKSLKAENIKLRKEIDQLKVERKKLKSISQERDNLLDDLEDVCKWVAKQDANWPPSECKRFNE